MNEQIARAARAKALFDQRNEQLGHLPAQILLALARNEAATREWRKAAVQMMMDKNFDVSHPDLSLLVLEIKAEQDAKQEVQAIVEAAAETDMDAEPGEPESGPFKASFTTDSM